MPENDLHNIDLRSEEVQDILTKVPHWMIRWGNVLFLSLILLLLLISWFVKYPDIILSEAVVTTEVPPQKEYARTSGKLDAILVEDNVSVKSGQPLAIIENTANYKDVFKLTSIIDTLTGNNRTFHFPIDSIPILFLGDVESSYSQFENSYILYQLNKEYDPFSNEATANRYSISELRRRLQTLLSQRSINENELALSKSELQRNKSLFDKGVVSAQEYENKQREYARAERAYKNFETQISQTREAISNAQKLSRGTEINREKEEVTLLKSVLQSFNQLKKAIRDWENRYVLQSDINGTVTFLNVWSVNQTVNQGDLVFTIIPSEEGASFIAKLKTPANNIGKVAIGQQVNIKLLNYPDQEFGVLRGTVERISLIPNNEGFYFIDVALPEKLITSYNKEIDFKQEMIGSAEIVTEDLRLIERFFYQFKNIIER